jgi:hypothetical protein
MPVAAATHSQFFWRDRSIRSRFRAGVSLHSHTMYSEESLYGASVFIAAVPYLRRAIQRQEAEYRRAHNISVDLQHGFWTPPLTPRQAYRLEQKQIEQRFQLPGLVSLTDHDDIRAGAQLTVLQRFSSAPVSTEWTIPFGETFFHLGVHNLPHDEAGALMRQLSAYTVRAQKSELAGLLELLNSHPDVLVVLNHPLWDEKGIGRQKHEAILSGLLSRYWRFIHALEINGLRTMRENQRVLCLGQDLDMPVVAGGDRHGVEPNAILNLSRAETLGGFVHEVRYQRWSHVVFMPQYRRPQILRIVDTVMDVLRDYPENFEGRRTWPDRVFYRHPETGTPVPFASVCGDRGMEVIARLVGALRVVASILTAHNGHPTPCALQ